MTASGIERDRHAVTVRAPAKINLHLGVGAVREDGFHPLSTVYQAIGLYDDVTATPAGPAGTAGPVNHADVGHPAGAARALSTGSRGWSIHTVADALIDLSSVPGDGANIAIRAGKALVAHHGRPELAAHLEVHKGIPVAGGMAGGSADAAAALVAVDRLFDLHTSDDDLLRIAATLGSDVPFALIGGTALGTGRGEIVDPVADTTTLWWIVVPHEIGLSTPGVYRQFDALGAALGPTEGAVLPEELLAALTSGDAGSVLGLLRNDLTAPAYALRPDLARRAADLGRLGAPVLLSGSGPTQLLPFRDVEAARSAAGRLTEAGTAHWLAPGPVAGCTVVSYA